MKRRAIIRRLAAITIGISIALTIFALPVVRAGVESTGVGSTFGGGGGGGITIAGTTISGGTNTRVLFQCSGVVCQDADLTFLTDTLTATKIVGSTSITDTGLTAGRMTFAGTAGILTDDSDCTFATDTLTCTKIIGSTSITDTGLTSGRVTIAGASGILSDDSDLTFLTDTLTATKIGTTSFTGTETVAAGAILTFTQSAGGGSAVAYWVTQNSTNGSAILGYPELTPDALYIGVGALSRSVHIGDTLDAIQAFDFNNGPCGTSACSNPTLIIHDNTQSTNKWLAFYHDTTNGVLDVGSGGISIPDGLAAYKAVNTTGWGVPAIYGTGRSTAQTAAVASVATYTVGAADGSFEVSANVLVTTATTHSFSVQVDYTDESNVARTLTLPMAQLAGTFAVSITNVTGAGPYEGAPLRIRCKASTSITIKTTGTFTTVTYNVEGAIVQVS